MDLYSIHKVNPMNIPGLCRVERILYRCGKDMAQRYDLRHWNNSHIKNVAVMALCLLKNRVYLVQDREGMAVATFQLRKNGQSLHFGKLATDPACTGKGIGSFCMAQIERMAEEESCKKVCCEVYDKSEHAICFYKNRGYRVCGSVNSLKYGQLQMEKSLEK